LHLNSTAVTESYIPSPRYDSCDVRGRVQSRERERDGGRQDYTHSHSLLFTPVTRTRAELLPWLLSADNKNWLFINNQTCISAQNQSLFCMQTNVKKNNCNIRMQILQWWHHLYILHAARCVKEKWMRHFFQNHTFKARHYRRIGLTISNHHTSQVD